MPVEDLEVVSRAIIETFDTLMPLQYPREDRERGHYLAEDRQGNIRETPLMSISIGCVTNVHRRFTHPARVSELANEMKSYAKTFVGSLFVVDRRRDARLDAADTAGAKARERGSRCGAIFSRHERGPGVPTDVERPGGEARSPRELSLTSLPGASA